jgi:hypothetical protein
MLTAKRLSTHLLFFMGLFLVSNATFAEGDCAGNCINRHGILTFSNGNRYVGEFKDCKYEGHGIIQANGVVYEGTFINNFLNGQTVVNYANGDKYEGVYINDKRHGKGIITYANGKKEETEWKDGKMERWKDDQEVK